MAFIAAIQVLMTYFSGRVLRTSGLNLREWAVVLGFASLIIPIDTLRKVLGGR
jgi:hypothetical protein